MFRGSFGRTSPIDKRTTTKHTVHSNQCDISCTRFPSATFPSCATNKSAYRSITPANSLVAAVVNAGPSKRLILA
jgi:hypothetical protein